MPLITEYIKSIYHHKEEKGIKPPLHHIGVGRQPNPSIWALTLNFASFIWADTLLGYALLFFAHLLKPII